jgi:uncharacterized protein (TIGR02246 family)
MLLLEETIVVKQISLIILAVSLVVVGACAPKPEPVEEVVVEEAPQTDPAADEAVLTAATEAWMAAFNAGDAAAIAALMAEDGMLFPPNAEPVSGREAIESFWQGFIDTGANAGLRLTQVIMDGDLAVKIGEYDLMDPEGEVFDTGKWMEAWTRVGDSWQMQRDIWNSNLPAAGAAE